MRDFITLSLVMLSVWIGLPCLCLGTASRIGLLDGGSDSGDPYLVVAALILLATTSWIWLRLRRLYASRDALGTSSEQSHPLEPAAGPDSNQKSLPPQGGQV